MKDNLKLGGDWHKPNRIHPDHKEDWLILGFAIFVICLGVGTLIVGLLKLIG